jgi:hypothetical protein
VALLIIFLLGFQISDSHPISDQIDTFAQSLISAQTEAEQTALLQQTKSSVLQDDETALRNLVDELFVAFEKEDQKVLLLLWSVKSPELVSRTISTPELFAQAYAEYGSGKPVLQPFQIPDG